MACTACGWSTAHHLLLAESNVSVCMVPDGDVSVPCPACGRRIGAIADLVHKKITPRPVREVVLRSAWFDHLVVAAVLAAIILTTIGYCTQ